LATYSYDALNRVTQVVYSGGSVPATLTYTYDQGAFGKGRLTSLTNSIGLASGWTHDQHGRVTQRTETIGTAVLTTQYAYQPGTGRLASMTYPAGGTLLYSYDANGRVTAITSSGGTAVSGVTYHPFGRVKGWTWGNGSLYGRSFDADGRVAAYTLGAQTFTVGYDPASRITSIVDVINPGNTNTYSYDNLDRLTGAILPATTYAYSYDAVGNRLTKSSGGNTDTYAYPGTSNRLSSVTPGSGPVKTYSYDAAGNISGDGTSSYLHDTRGRLVLATLAGVQSERHYNGLGQRTYRFFSSAPDFVIIGAYDEVGRPIGEYIINTATGGVYGNETVYLEGIPVAIAAFNDPPGAGNTERFGPFYLHPDHLDTPRLVTDVANQVLWRWDQAEPFGTSPANENPSGLGTFGINYRFPGQYLDKASNTHYNYFRDYDPAIGRYIQSDPIGLRGGVNTYLYVGGNPLRWTDPLGLKSRICCRLVPGVGVFGFRHCYVETQNSGGSGTFGLIGGSFAGMPGCGQVFSNNAFDTGGACGPWKDECDTDNCVKKAVGGYNNPSEYSYFGPNSNTFASTVATTCGLQAPNVSGTLGWGQKAAPAFPGVPQISPGSWQIVCPPPPPQSTFPE
jgi:RHS repeat-associated protein